MIQGEAKLQRAFNNNNLLVLFITFYYVVISQP